VWEDVAHCTPEGYGCTGDLGGVGKHLVELHNKRMREMRKING
jgi:hypothetical protein